MTDIRKVWIMTVPVLCPSHIPPLHQGPGVQGVSETQGDSDDSENYRR